MLEERFGLLYITPAFRATRKCVFSGVVDDDEDDDDDKDDNDDDHYDQHDHDEGSND